MNDNNKIKTLKLPNNWINEKDIAKENIDEHKKIFIKVIALKIRCHYQTSGLDLFSQTVLNFHKIKNIPSNVEIANRMGLPIEAIDRIETYLIQEGYLNKVGKIQKREMQKPDFQELYVFYESESKELIDGIVLTDPLEDTLIKYFSNEDIKAYENLKISNDFSTKKELPNVDRLWLQQSEFFDDKELLQIEKIKDHKYLLPLHLYFKKNEVHWKVQDPFDKEKFSTNLKEILRQLQNNGYKTLSREILSFCKKASDIKNKIKEEHLQKAKQNVIDRLGEDVCRKNYFNELIELENIILKTSENADFQSREYKNIYSKINKTLEYILQTKTKEIPNIQSRRNNIKALFDALNENTTWNADDDIASIKKEWILDIYEKRKTSDHSSSMIFSKSIIEKDIEEFYEYILLFEGIKKDEKTAEGSQERYNSDKFKKTRLRIEEKSVEWSFLPEEVITDYAFYQAQKETPKEAMEKAKFWESVLKWYVKKYQLDFIETTQEWRRRVKENFSDEEEKIKESLTKTQTNFVKNAAQGLHSTLGAYAVLVFLSEEPKGNKEELQKVLGMTWWRELEKIVNERDNHAKNKF